MPAVESGKLPASWTDLFAAGEGARKQALQFMVVQRQGHPLVIARAGAPVGPALSLYPAQTPLARLAKAIWRVLWPVGAGPGLARETLLVDPGSPFLEFLRQVVGSPGLPPFALLAGNPREPGRRFIVLVFDSAGHPVAVVKAGTRPEAVELVRREAAFLESLSGTLDCAPAVRGRFDQGNLSAFATDYIEGRSPEPGESKRMLAILSQWLRPDPQVPVRELAAWRALEANGAQDPLFARTAEALAGATLRPALFHGDLAPWNVKVSRDGWTILDWERGVTEGPPAWDWFHYVMQPAILVRRLAPSNLVHVAEDLLADPRFQEYARAAGLAGRERAWFLAYLLHCRHVLRPAAGLAATIAMIERFELPA